MLWRRRDANCPRRDPTLFSPRSFFLWGWCLSCTPFCRGVSHKTSWGLRLTTRPLKRVMNFSPSNQRRVLPPGSSSAHWKKSHSRLEHLKKRRPGFFSELDMVRLRVLLQKHFILVKGNSLKKSWSWCLRAGM